MFVDDVLDDVADFSAVVAGTLGDNDTVVGGFAIRPPFFSPNTFFSFVGKSVSLVLLTELEAMLL